MDIGVFQLRTPSRKWAAYTLAVFRVLATFQKPEPTAC